MRNPVMRYARKNEIFLKNMEQGYTEISYFVIPFAGFAGKMSI